MDAAAGYRLVSAWDGRERPTLAQMRSADYDRPPDGKVRHKVLICSAPRTASSHLARLCFAAGIGIPMEYFNSATLDELARRWGVARPFAARFGSSRFAADYVDGLMRRRAANGIFSTKIQFWQLRRYLTNEAGRKLFAGALVVFLTRPDIRGQAVSLAAARLSGEFGFDEEVPDTSFSEARMRRALRKSLDIIVGETTGWHRFLGRAGIRPLHFTTEQVAADRSGVIDAIAASIHAEVDRRSLDRMIAIDGAYERSDLKKRLSALAGEMSPRAWGP